MFRITQTLEGWDVATLDGETVYRSSAWTAITAGAAPTRRAAFDFGRAYADALGFVGRQLSVIRAAAGEQGLLPESWMSPDDGGIAFSEMTGDGWRDFSDCKWTWRDPAAGIVPLMLQTSNDWGHMGAELSGFTEKFSQAGGSVAGRGRFYETEAGETFRGLLLDSRAFGVSVDPGVCEVEEDCLSVDEEGWCDQWVLRFLAYEIIGLTGTPFPGFATASIVLDPDTVTDMADMEDAEPVMASADPCSCGGTCSTCTPVTPIRFHQTIRAASATPHVEIQGTPPRRYFDNPDFAMPSPLTITNDGRVLSHVAIDGTCHTGYQGDCLVPPTGCDFRDFLQGRVLTEEGEFVTTGVLTWGMDHPEATLSFHEAQAAYGHSDYGWADVTIGYDRFGTWVSGALRPGITDDDVRVLRALALSGDWRVTRRTGRHEVIGVLAVNYPGFPIVAAGSRQIAAPRPRVTAEVITAAGMVPPKMHGDLEANALLARLQQVENLLGGPARERLTAAARADAVARLRAGT